MLEGFEEGFQKSNEENQKKKQPEGCFLIRKILLGIKPQQYFQLVGLFDLELLRTQLFGLRLKFCSQS